MTLGPEGGKNKILLQIWGQYKKWYITLCSMIAKKTIISVAAWDVVAAAPKAIPSAVNRSNKKVLLITLCNGQRKMDMICWHMVNHSPAAWTTKPKVAWNDLLFLEVPLSGSVKKYVGYHCLVSSIHHSSVYLPLDFDVPIWSMSSINTNPSTNARPITEWIPSSCSCVSGTLAVPFAFSYFCFISEQ